MDGDRKRLVTLKSRRLTHTGGADQCYRKGIIYGTIDSTWTLL